MDIDPGKILPSIVELAEEAAEKILEVYNSDFSVQNKDDKSPLTEADLASHRAILAGLARLTPAIPVLSEESADITWDVRKNWDTYWLVDPLDGTKEFIKRNGEFTVNIALVQEHRPVLGVVNVPASGTCYYAAEGQGACRKDRGQPAAAISTRPTEPGAFTVAGSRSHGSDRQQTFFSALGEQTEVIAIGSSLKFCLVAEGRVDIYPRFGPTSEWDTAAAHAIVLEAGGLVTKTDLAPLLYNTKDSILNPHFLVIADRKFNWAPYLDKHA